MLRWLAALVTVALLVGSVQIQSAAASYEASKLDAVLLSEILADPGAEYDVIVRSDPDSSSGKGKVPTRDARAQRAADAVKKQGGKAKFALGIVGGAAATMRGAQLLKLSRDSSVDFIYRDYAMRASFDPAAAADKVASPAINVVKAPQVWTDLGVTGKGVGVAVVDSGVAAHPDLAGRVVAAIDLTSTEPTLSNVPLGDLGGHGTHVAGLVAGDGTASGGRYTGVAPAANIIDVRVIDETGSSNVYPERQVTASGALVADYFLLSGTSMAARSSPGRSRSCWSRTRRSRCV